MIFKNQTKLRLNANTNLSASDHATISAALIKYEKPDGTEGSFSATAGTAPYVYYDTVNTTDLDQAGTWTMWAYCTFAGGLVAPGKIKKVIVALEGDQ